MSCRRMVRVGDVELCVETFGDPVDPPVLLVAGAAASMDWWDDDLCRRLAAGRRHVVRYDHRDTGESTTGHPGSPGYGGMQLTRDCLGLIESLRLGEVHLVGVSMGGAIAQVLALRRPDLLASLTLVSTTSVGGTDSEQLPGPTADLRASFGSPPPEPDWSDAAGYADWVVAGQRPYAGSIGLDEPRVRAVALGVHARSHDPAAAANHWLVVGEDDEADAELEPLDVRRITVSTLVVHGSEDPLFPLPHGRALAEAIRGATLLVVPGMGHEVPPAPAWDVVVPAVLRHTAGQAHRLL
ncbi:MAG TPA: alpha/beta hydrolase [Nocardioides sp.]|uniref:alpha/beta hydrolase n=1 Tax=Nocardioides sp. TaxID=35761 RepID=UPI002E345D84|nr:alpha/beta hydrolase [Nocardioides sp.]HEX3930145.1 alpha/beta hydrolase [Nocardioides sp.]